ncbi:prenyltransferase/squalene oxidase repeat-containing protein [Conexibacter sp. CPCC 206217]|uniref:prenyltransferase/squalene oxidase repeat-containing protein n=1 Tax=Conexibacter sp. CPCC 206217 TaxID=3064574 RepID=UPI00271D3457|nr:prenyltransferase/squalene oxidase repeat-containing protein [Conexibacter sp. CPCC 206217]MDO8212319.1 prenyltransferase/squalene oxidase repeat-containing protein [Conexibacter sp. CPCC 206217]
MTRREQRRPASSRTRAGVALLALLAATLLVGPLVARACAAGNASRAVGFIEEAQNRDGGFGAQKGGASDPLATLWASAALLAAGKNPRDEFLKNGRSAEDYLVAHAASYSSLEQLGLLALVQNASRLGASAFGRPLDRLRPRLSESAVRADPRGVAFAILGLLSADNGQARATARSAAQSLLASTTSDGAWGPDGNADSASTALVLQALAATGVANRDTPQVTSGFAYLRNAQVNDGAIAESTRVDKASAGGSVAATAYTIQALNAFGLGSIRTSTGKTERQGLTQYQQQSSGGLTSKGGIYSQVAPSVVETSQAFPAFNGVSLQLPVVRSTSGGPDAARKRADAKKRAADRAKHDNSQKRESTGTSSDGASSGTSSDASSDTSAADDPGAFERATAGGNDDEDAAHGRSGGGAAGPDARSAPDDAKRSASADRADAQSGGAADRAGDRSDPPAAAGGDEVSGAVVRASSGPPLQTRAGADDSGLTNRQRATIAVGALLGLLLLAGIATERLRPRPTGARPLSTEAIAGVQAAARPVVRGAAKLGGAGVRDPASGRRLVARRRWPLLLVLALGAALIALPAATKMFERAPQGATMIDAFAPYMTSERLASFQRDVREVDEYADEALTKAPQIFVPGVSDPQQRQQQFLTRSPQVALFSQQWPDVHRTFTRLLGTIQGNKANYDAVAALPPFTLFPWFFVVPGALLIVLALAGLLLGRRRPASWIPLRRATIALGVGLVLAPVAFQMFTRAPQGGRMVDAFRTIETRRTVQTVQGHFGTIAVGQGAIRTELVPRLQARGWSDARLRQQLPASMRLQRRWTAILNNLTPMIGVMSDNVVNYRAVAALPPFPLFPWLFVVPGLLAIALALLAGRRPQPARPSPPSDHHDTNEDLPCTDTSSQPSRLALPV